MIHELYLNRVVIKKKKKEGIWGVFTVAQQVKDTMLSP